MDQQFSLSWNNFHGNLSKGFAGLLGKGEFVDVTIAVEGHLLQAHKVILSICSPYFKKMFQSNPCQHPIVLLRDVSYKAMTDLLQFMYHGEVSVKQEELTTFIGTAEVLQIKGLTNREHNEQKDNNNADLDPESKSKQTESSDATLNDRLIQNNGYDLSKHREFIDKLETINNLKRKSEEHLHQKYFPDVQSFEKRPKLRQKYALDVNGSKENKVSPPSLQVSNQNMNKHANNADQPVELLLKTEIEENDTSVADGVCTTPQDFDEPLENITAIENYHTPQDSYDGINSFLVKLKKLVSDKVSPNSLGMDDNGSGNCLEHRITTIPQKEDCKKKYPQRSCRLCWRIGKRRDTRFMCKACELPLCKSPCFDVHFNDVLKLSQLRGDYYI